MRVDSARDLTIILLVWVAMIAIINPIGDFPLNDDWSYARPVHSLVNHGELELLGWPAMTLIAHVLWGALVCLSFGFSFTALRFSTLVLALLTLLVFHKTLREVGASRSIAFWGTLIIAANPLFLNLANTFMTDVPFLTLAMFSVFFFIRALKNSRRNDLWLGTILAIMAAFIRQLGVFIPIAFAAAHVYRNGSVKKTPVSAYIPAIAGIVLLLVYQLYLQGMHRLPASLGDSTRTVLTRFLTEPVAALELLFRTGIKSALYLGLFLLPLILLSAHRLLNFRERTSCRSFVGFLVIGGFLTSCVLVSGKLIPMLPNMIYNLGLGPPTLRDTYLLDLPHLPTAPQGFWLVVTVAGIFGGSTVLLQVIQTSWGILKKRRTPEARTTNAIALFIVTIVLLYVIPLSILGFRDRYLLFCLPLVMLLWANGSTSTEIRAPGWSKSVSAVILLLFGIYAVGGTHDYLNWNRARWKALRELTEQKGVPPCQIDGGFEFNGWYCYDENYSEVATKSWWWVKQDDYVIAFGQIPGFVDEKKFEYIRWIPPGRGHIFLLKKATPQDIAATSSIRERPSSRR